jgi:hypothetical protein
MWLDRGPYWLRAGKNFVCIAILFVLLKSLLYLVGYYPTLERLGAELSSSILTVIGLSLWFARKRVESENKNKNHKES